MLRTYAAVLASALTIAATVVPALAASDFVNFESGQARPLALSPDGTRLFAVNTPDNQLEIFTLGAGGPTHAGSVAVGLEPVAAAARTNTEVWVVNHLSDSISIIDVAAVPPRVVRTLLTCDEPTDLVFAGPGEVRAFVTTARRGQNCPVAANSTTAGTPRAIVQVWDATLLDPIGPPTLAGTPIANLELFGDTPRALARSADGNTVYAGIFQSGNQTTTVFEGTVCDGGATASPCGAFLQFPGGLPAPNVNVENITGPEVGLLVRFDPTTNRWNDPIGRDWSAAVPFSLPDQDVFAIDAAAPTPTATTSFAHVGTVLFNMVANPINGKVYVSNTEARNEVRFEGPGLAFNSTTVQGHLHEARITILDGTNVLPRHLNKHIDYSQRPAPPSVKPHSLATPVGMAVTSDGTTLFVAAFSSNKLGVFNTAALENDSFLPDVTTHIPLSGGGPTGMVLDEARGLLYALTRFDNAVSVVSLASRTEIAHTPLHSPEPAAVVNGRRFLYDATLTSSNGEASCASCHIFGDLDHLAWDLGNPDDTVLNDPLPQRIPPLLSTFVDFHPLKGPMTTQSLRGMANHGSMHWRGDRTGGNDPGGDVFDEDAAFKKFNGAFPGLIGRTSELSDADMQAFTDFVLTVTYPPNPIRRLNDTLTNQQQQGSDLYFGPLTDVLFNCNGCHTLDPANGFFGGDGFNTFEGETQMFKVPHLRNVYQKIGMFSVAGPQVRGFGVLHDGTVDTIFRFLGASVFSLTNAQQRRLEQFVLAFDSNLKPIVGQQVTLTDANAAAVTTRLDLLMAQAAVGACEVTVKGPIAGEPRGAVRQLDGTFQLDRASDVPLADLDLRAVAAVAGQPLTYTCAPPGSGRRMGIDRDGDGALDRDELEGGTDPSDPGDFPVPITMIRFSALKLRDDVSPPIVDAQSRLALRATTYRHIPSGVTVPAWGSSGDPTLAGARLRIYRANGGGMPVVLTLPASNWTRTGSVTEPGYRYTDPKHALGTVRTVKLKSGSLAVSARGADTYQLDGAPEGTLALRFRVGNGIEFCLTADPKAPTATTDTTRQYVGDPSLAPTPTCPLVPIDN